MLRLVLPGSRARERKRAEGAGSRVAFLSVCLAASALLAMASCGPSSNTAPPSPTAVPGVPTLRPIPTLDPTVDALRRFGPGVTSEQIQRFEAMRRQCSRLPEDYVKLIALPDPERRAAEEGIKIQDGKTDITIFYEGWIGLDLVKEDMVRRFHVEVLAVGVTALDVRAPLDTLCDLSNYPGVRRIVPRTTSLPGNQEPSQGPRSSVVPTP